MLSSPWFAELSGRLRAATSPNETLAALFISASEHVTDALMREGEPDRISLPTRQIIEQGMRINARQVLLVHTHPSGDPRPSRQDIIVTQKLHAHLQTHNLGFYDHIILSQDRYFSFRACGLL